MLSGDNGLVGGLGSITHSPLTLSSIALPPPLVPERRIGLVKQTFWISYYLNAVTMTNMTDSI